MSHDARIALIGAGDLGQTVALHLRQTPGKRAVGFFDDTKPGQVILDLPVLGGLADVAARWRDGAFDAALITIGYRHLARREAIFDQLRALGVPMDVQIYPGCVIAGTATVEEGAILFPGCVLDEGARVRANSLLNAGCVIAHDSALGPHTFCGPGVTLAGFVDVGARCFLGVGTVIIDNLRLGHDTQTGGGAVIVRSHDGGGLLLGIPAREVHRPRSNS